MTNTIERPQSTNSGEPPRRNVWGDTIEDQQPSTPNKKKSTKVRNALFAAGGAALLAAGAVVGVNTMNSGSAEGSGPDGDDTTVDQLRLTEMSSLVLSPSEIAAIEAGDSDAPEVHQIMDEWINIHLNPYIANGVLNIEHIDIVPRESLSDTEHAALLDAVNAYLKEHINEDNEMDVWRVCPTTNQGEYACIINGETYESFIGIGPTNEIYDAKLAILHVNSGTKTVEEITIGNGDGSTVKMVIGDNGELLTR